MAQDKPTVLYVDDLAINLKLFEATFKRDYDIILTESPLEALKILKEREIQVLVSDHRMPEMTGTELLEIAAREHPDIRRYLLTAFTDTETVIEAVNRGRIHGYIKKPIQPEEIRQSINNSLEAYYLRIKNRKILKELEKVNEELLNLDGLKSEIINAISNEISTPLNRIMGTLHLLKTKIEGNELYEVVNILDQSVFKLEQFSLLAKQVSDLKSPGFELKFQKVSVRQVIQYASIETSEELKDNGISLKKDPEEPDYEIKGDSGLLVSCLVNLIRFAREHTEPKNDIRIVTLLKDGQPAIRVEDQGVNYSDVLFDFLSNHFSSANTALSLNMGIGLAVSRIIMEAHGGRLVFEKNRAHRGCFDMVICSSGISKETDAP